MSEQLFLEVAAPTVRVGTKTWKTVPLSIAAHVVVFGALVVVPLMAAGVMPTPQSVLLYVAPPIVPSPPVVTPPRPAVSTPTKLPNPAAAPTVEGSKISDEPTVLPQMSDIAVPGAPTLPFGGSVPGFGPPAVAPPPASPPPPRIEPHRVGGAIKEPAKIRDVRPIYPVIAQNAKISGIVIIEATIGRDGMVTDTRVLRSVPLLDQAALDAVRQWRFTPTLLNGVPVPVLMTVTVNFTLQ